MNMFTTTHGSVSASAPRSVLSLAHSLRGVNNDRSAKPRPRPRQGHFHPRPAYHYPDCQHGGNPHSVGGGRARTRKSQYHPAIDDGRHNAVAGGVWPDESSDIGHLGRRSTVSFGGHCHHYRSIISARHHRGGMDLKQSTSIDSAERHP